MWSSPGDGCGDVAGILLFWGLVLIYLMLNINIYFLKNFVLMNTVRWDVTKREKSPNFKLEVVVFRPSPSLRVGHAPFNQMLSADVDVAINPVVMDDEQIMKWRFKKKNFFFFLMYFCFGGCFISSFFSVWLYLDTTEGGYMWVVYRNLFSLMGVIFGAAIVPQTVLWGTRLRGCGLSQDGHLLELCCWLFSLGPVRRYYWSQSVSILLSELVVLLDTGIF